MTGAHVDRPTTATSDRYQALLAVSAAIVAHRDLSALFHDLARRLQQVVRFDYQSKRIEIGFILSAIRAGNRDRRDRQEP
jgi:hypothetical protein